MSKIRFNPIFISLIILNIFSSIYSKPNNDDITKAISCMSMLMQRLGGNNLDNKEYSSKLLKCFITITLEEAKEFVVALEQGMKTIENKDFERLTDTSTLSSLTQDELSKYSLHLENTIKEFKKLQDSYAKKSEGKSTSGPDEEDEEYRRNHPSRGNSLGSFMKKLTGALKLVNNMGNVVIFIIFAYFLYILFGKYCKSDKKNKEKPKPKEKEKKNKKSKKKNE